MKVRVLVVDDSATMRGLIGAALKRDPDIEVVGFAKDPLEAREKIKALNPDVVTLDVEMPRMNGLDFLERIMRLRPTPVVMISSHTRAGTEATLSALELGAVDCVGKPGPDQAASEAFGDLAAKIKTAAQARVRPYETPRAAPLPVAYRPREGLVLAIGSSTGGVEALTSLFAQFPANCPPTVVAQHMPAAFTRSFAARLDRVSAATVTESRDAEPLLPGHIYLAPGGTHHLTVRGGDQAFCRLVSGDAVSGHRPSVDVLFHSLSKLSRPMVGAILTGMGRDGAEGLLAMRQAGGQTIGQDEQSCVVFGMPRAAHEIGAVGRQVSLDHMATTLLDLCAAVPAPVRSH